MANAIASERRRAGLTQRALADRLGVSLSKVSRWETGRCVPFGADLVKMHEVFGCSTDYLLGISEERNHARM